MDSSLPETVEEAPKKKLSPEIGTIKVKYGKRADFRGACNTCDPQWRGPFQSMRKLAMADAVTHAMSFHQWLPNMSDNQKTSE